MTHESMPPEVRETMGIASGLIRISVGIEECTDLNFRCRRSRNLELLPKKMAQVLSAMRALIVAPISLSLMSWRPQCIRYGRVWT